MEQTTIHLSDARLEFIELKTVKPASVTGKKRKMKGNELKSIEGYTIAGDKSFNTIFALTVRLIGALRAKKFATSKLHTEPSDDRDWS